MGDVQGHPERENPCCTPGDPGQVLKAAALLQSIVDNHALIDGNKRLGWLAAAVFLEINDASVAAASNDDVYDLVMAIAAGASTTEGIAAKLQQLHPRRA